MIHDHREKDQPSISLAQFALILSLRLLIQPARLVLA
jgi:hypothetical protein